MHLPTNFFEILFIKFYQEKRVKVKKEKGKEKSKLRGRGGGKLSLFYEFIILSICNISLSYKVTIIFNIRYETSNMFNIVNLEEDHSICGSKLHNSD